LELLDGMNPKIEELTKAVEQEVRKRPDALCLMTHPGVGPLTALAYVLIIGTPTRFPRDKQIGTYVGMIPCEDSSAGKQRLGHISKQGNSLLRFLLVEAAQAAARVHPDWRRRYVHLAMRRHKSIAKVAMGRSWRCSWLPGTRPLRFEELTCSPQPSSGLAFVLAKEFQNPMLDSDRSAQTPRS
jgi:transposase